MHNKSKNRKNGFTLIELLVVIAIISLLSTVVIASVSTAREKAKIAKTKSKMAEFSKIVSIAEAESGKTLGNITGTYYTSWACNNPPTYSSLNPLPDIRNLDATHLCRVNFINSLNKIAEATVGAYSSTTIILQLSKDEWGSPFLLDENQGEGGNCLTRFDIIRSAGPDGFSSSADDILIQLPSTENCP